MNLVDVFDIIKHVSEGLDTIHWLFVTHKFALICVLQKLHFCEDIAGTWGRTRTDTVLLPPEFESSASTNFATQARPASVTLAKGLKRVNARPI